MLSKISNEIKYWDTSWDFRTADTKYSNHGYHTYPAMMIPQIARRLIQTYGKDAKVLLDPFMGSGTTGIACLDTGHDFVGVDREEEYVSIATQRVKYHDREDAGWKDIIIHSDIKIPKSEQTQSGRLK